MPLLIAYSLDKIYIKKCIFGKLMNLILNTIQMFKGETDSTEVALTMKCHELLCDHFLSCSKQNASLQMLQYSNFQYLKRSISQLPRGFFKYFVLSMYLFTSTFVFYEQVSYKKGLCL